MSDAQLQTLLAMLKRVGEMRANMEGFAADLDKVGLTGLSFDRWRAELDEKEQSIQQRIRRITDARRT